MQLGIDSESSSPSEGVHFLCLSQIPDGKCEIWDHQLGEFTSLFTWSYENDANVAVIWHEVDNCRIRIFHIYGTFHTSHNVKSGINMGNFSALCEGPPNIRATSLLVPYILKGQT